MGVNPLTGRPRIAEQVLEGMRQYLMVANGDIRKTRESKVKKLMAEVEKDPLAQKNILRLEPTPIVSHDLNKGKGLLFDYDSSVSLNKTECFSSSENKIMSAAIRAGEAMRWKPEPKHTNSDACPWSPEPLPFPVCRTVNRAGFPKVGSSRITSKKGKARKMPYKSRRIPKGLEESMVGGTVEKKVGLEEGVGGKRKSEKELEREPEIVPKEGMSNFQ